MGRSQGVLLAAACALGLAACGGDSQDNAYVAAVNRAQTDFATRFDRLRDQITATSTPEQDRRTLGRFSAAVDDAVGDLRAIEPPEPVAGLHQRLVRSIGRYGTEIDQARKAFASTDPKRVLAAQTELVSEVSEISGDINAVIGDINEELRG